MTEVEISRLLAQLSETAEVLNRESDSINGLIAQLEETLRKLNVGIEVWLRRPALNVNADEEETGHEDQYGNPIMQRTQTETHLGFARLGDRWQMAVRDEFYRYNEERFRWDFASLSASPTRLLDATRENRIAALAAFPDLLKLLHEEAQAAVATIQAAKKLVK